MINFIWNILFKKHINKVENDFREANKESEEYMKEVVIPDILALFDFAKQQNKTK